MALLSLCFPVSHLPTHGRTYTHTHTLSHINKQNNTCILIRAVTHISRCTKPEILAFNCLFVCLFVCIYAPIIATTAPVCPKCGANKSKKRSCCFRGGTWFKKCGEENDSKFGHTWDEGTQACTGLLPAHRIGYS